MKPANPRILTINGGSSSIRFAPFEAGDSLRRPLETVKIDGVELSLATPAVHDAHWIDYNDYVRQLQAAWLRLSDTEVPLNPRMIGEPGLASLTIRRSAYSAR